MGKLDEKILDKFFASMKEGDDKRIVTLSLAKGVKEYVDLDYTGQDGKNPYHLMNIYRPESAGDKVLPVIIDVHGGGWGYGDKELYKFYCYALATRGFAVASFNYTLMPDALDISVIIKDIFGAINYTAAHAEEYKLDKNNFFITGDSAGGHLTGMTLAVIADEKLQELYGVKTEVSFNAAVFNCASYNPNRYLKLPVSVAKAYIGRFYNHDRILKKNKYFSSVNVFNARLEKFPPMYLISCYNDMGIIRQETRKFAKLLDSKGIKYVFEYWEEKDCKNGMGHVYSVLHPLDWEESVKTNDNVCNFFKTYLK